MLPVHDTRGVVDAIASGGYAELSRLVSRTSLDGTVTYSYDPASQLIAADYSDESFADESYTYDANGNRVTANGYVYTTGEDNRLLSDGTYWYAYDPEGNRVARFIDVNVNGILDSGDTDVTKYTWDARNRLVNITDYEAYGGDPTQVVDYLYDLENRWIGKLVDSDGDGTIDHQTAFVYNGNQIVLEFENDGGPDLTAADLSHRYLWQPDAVDQIMADEQVASPDAEGDVVLPLGDHLGTVRDLAVHDPTTDTTAVANHIAYDAYGRKLSETNAAIDSLFGFTGRAFDETTEIQNNLNRWYDASTGRWISKDPVGFEGKDANAHRYVGNSPTRFVDPSGTEQTLVGEVQGGSFYEAKRLPGGSTSCTRAMNHLRLGICYAVPFTGYLSSRESPYQADPHQCAQFANMPKIHQTKEKVEAVILKKILSFTPDQPSGEKEIEINGSQKLDLGEDWTTIAIYLTNGTLKWKATIKIEWDSTGDPGDYTTTYKASATIRYSWTDEVDAREDVGWLEAGIDALFENRGCWWRLGIDCSYWIQFILVDAMHDMTFTKTGSIP